MVPRPALFLIGLIALAVVLVSLSVASEGAEALQYDVELNLKDAHHVKKASGLNPVTFNYTVKHTGEVLSEEVYLQMEDVPPYWQVFFSIVTSTGMRTGGYTPDTPFEFLLVRDEVAQLTITVTAPANALNATYWMTVKVWPRKDTNQEVSHTFGVIIVQKADFEFVIWNPPPGGEFKAIPPSTITIRFALFNTGNGLDRFKIRGDCSRSEVGWTLTFDSGVDEWGFTPDLSPDMGKEAPHFIDVKVPIPAGEPAGAMAQVTVNATSMFDQSVSRPPALATLFALQYFNFQVYTIGPDSKEGDLGGAVEFQLRIDNLGNGMDTFTINAIWDPELNPDFVASAVPRSIDIESDSTGTVRYVVNVPAIAMAKTYFFTAEVASSSSELSPVTRSFAVEVGSHYAVVLSTGAGRMTTIPGGLLDFEVTVRNAGNTLDSIVIEVSDAPRQWLTYVQPPEVTLLLGEEAEVKVRVIVPARFEEAPMGVHTLTVVARSSRGDAQATLSLEVEVLQVFRVEWMFKGEPITDPSATTAKEGIIGPRQTVNPNEQDEVVLTLEVRNFGNGNDNVTFRATSAESRVTVEVVPAFTLLLRGQTKAVKVTVTIPKGLPGGVYTVHAIVSSQDPSEEPRVVPVDFEVVGVDVAVPPIPTYLDPVDGPVVTAVVTVGPGTEARFTLDVLNNGTLAVTSVRLRGFDRFEAEGSTESWNFINLTVGPIAVGDHVVVGEGPVTEGNPGLVWRSSRTGVHVLEFRVSCEGQTEGSNDVSTVTVNVKAPPKVVLDDDDIQVRKGDKLIVSGTAGDDTTEIEWVKGRVDGGDWVNASGTREWTLEFESGALDKGKHTLEVMASDGDMESPVLETTFEVEPAYRVEDTPGLGAVATLLAIAGVSTVVIGRSKKG